MIALSYAHEAERKSWGMARVFLRDEDRPAGGRSEMRHVGTRPVMAALDGIADSAEA